MMMHEAAVADEYDVFLSFRGDIRSGFVSVLYDYLDRAQIRVFRDNVEIDPGTQIGQSIFKSIENSGICIPIFSKNYASSKWCLKEVTKMVELDRKIIPIFYDVEPSEVLAGVFDEAMREHHEKQESEEVNGWKNALTTVGNLKGMSLDRTSYADFCKSVTTRVLSILRATKGHKRLRGVVDYGYDVFISYAGLDQRQGFISVFYDYLVRAGFRVSKDYDIQHGQIGETIHNALVKSKICVPIFSKGYASSRWCLRELTNIVELKKKIIPIFYDVTPDDVKLKTPVYRYAISKHSKNVGSEEVKRWENALKEVAKIKGMEVRMNNNEVESMVDFCKRLTTELSILMKPRKRYDGQGLVGMSKAVDSVMTLLNTECSDVRFIGITGMGGIGKTTLAKFVFDLLSPSFDHSAFIEDIRECSGRHGLNHLEQQLREKLDPKFIINSNLSRDIKQRFHQRKVLIVLDDVDNQKQIEMLAQDPTWFGMGSRIIITSRNIKDVLTDYHRVDEYSKFTMEMETLELDQALQLFCMYAFGSNIPPTPTLEHLSKQVVSNAGGLPLTITILGSRLRNKKNKAVWEEVIERSQKVPLKEVMERLRISYDALDIYAQKVFLDIACFFIGGEEMTNASYMWRACNFYPLMSLATLDSMSLVKTTKENKIWMHDQLRDLGRHIVENHSSHLAERTRIWTQEEAISVLMSNKNKEKVTAIRLVEPCNNSYTWNRKPFLSLVNLSYLQLKGANFLMNFEGLLPNLIWLSWHSFPGEIKGAKLPLTNLVILDLSSSSIDENWDGWSQIQTAKKLKVLDLTSCQNLTTTPEFSEQMPLERLILKGCKKLASLHSSIAGLDQLKHLNLEECSLLGDLPDGIRSLETLTEMPIAGSGLNLSMESHQI